MKETSNNANVTSSIVVEAPPELIHGQKSQGLMLEDFYYLFFRHKGKIILGFLTGVLAVGLIYNFWPKVYQSHAKLLIRYVTESRAPSEMVGQDSHARSPDQRGETIINTEIEILTSRDLAMTVAELIGPAKVVDDEVEGSPLHVAASIIMKQMKVEAPKNSKVIHTSFHHSDAEMAQQILQFLINNYLEKHVEVHRSVGIFDDLLTRERDQLRQRLIQTDEALRQLKAQAGVTSVETAKESFLVQITKIRNSIFETEAELAKHQALFTQIFGNEPLESVQKDAPPLDTHQLILPQAPVEKIEEYKAIVWQEDLLLQREQQFLLQFTDQSPLVKGIRDELTSVRLQRRSMESQFPGIEANASVNLPGLFGESRNDGISDSMSHFQNSRTNQMAQVVALESKYQVLTNQLALLRVEASKLDLAEGDIQNLERQREIEDSQYRLISQTKEQARIDEALGDGRVSNINIIQLPSAPSIVMEDLTKAMALAFLGLFGLPFGWAIASEFIFDRSIRLAKDIENRLTLPLQLVIPRFGKGSQRKLRRLYRKKQKALAKSNGLPTPSEKEPPPWEMLPGMRSYYESLRDAVVDDFEIRKLTKKPKLVAVAGCESGSGVTSIAGGLAGTLSEIGDGKVLLVDMHHGGAETQYFHGGQLKCGLSDLLDSENQEDAKVQENLYLADGLRCGVIPHEEGLEIQKPPTTPQQRITPKFFSNMAPKLKASDYDYIIFDMPKIDRMSVTMRFARFMDTFLVVAESEKTPRETLRRVSDSLKQSGTHFKVILNKHRSYIPNQIYSDL